MGLFGSEGATLSNLARHLRTCRGLANNCLQDFRWHHFTNQIPVPCLASGFRARVLQWLALQIIDRKAHREAVTDQAIAVRGYQVCHQVASPAVSMQPQATFHCMNHPIAPPIELSELNV